MMKLPPQVDTVLTGLEQAGFEAFVVGGAVRDWVRDASPAQDWDVATSALPGQVEEVFRDRRLIETGLKHGTVTVVVDHLPVEVTTYRVDVGYSDRRHPDAVRFTASLRDDLERRDFTMNALAYSPKTGIVDLVGGREDLARGLVRCVGDPGRRFREDGLRMLRALRFASVLEMEVEEATAAAIHENKHLLGAIAAERIQAELTKLLCGPGVGRILTEFADVLAVSLPEIVPAFGFEQHNPHHDKDVWGHTVAVVSAVRPEPALRWAALLHDIGKPGCFSLDGEGTGHFYGHGEQSARLAGGILSRLRFDNGGRERILGLVRHHDQPLLAERKPVKRLMNKHGVEAARQLIELHRADTLGQSALCLGRLDHYRAVEARMEELLGEEACFSLRDLAVGGGDIMALGFRGRGIGRALRACLEAVMDERVANEREALLAFAREQGKEAKAPETPDEE